MKEAIEYKGWKISHNTGPFMGPTARYSASRHGVSMCGNTLEMIKSMINTKIWLSFPENTPEKRFARLTPAN